MCYAGLCQVPLCPSAGTAAASEEGAVALPQTRFTHPEVALRAPGRGDLHLGWASGSGLGDQHGKGTVLRAGWEGRIPEAHAVVFLGHSPSSMKALAVKGVLGLISLL